MNKELEIYCSIHLGNSPLSEMLTLTCNHRFCIECLIGDWTNSINSGFVDSSRLKCPNEGCNVPIEYNELKGNLPKEVFQKYEEFSFNTFMLKNDEKSKEKTIICPDPKCQTKSFIWEGASFFTCWKCKNKYCGECAGEWKDHERLTCKEYEEYKKNNLNKNDVDFEKMMEKEKWMKCPKCKSIVEKIEFCNFIRCQSNICQKNVCFCYLCGEILKEEDHYLHYQDHNPYANKCKNYGKIKKIEKINGKKENNYIKKELKIPCPGCRTKNSDFCEIFWEKFTKCNKDGCKYKGKIVCLKCKETFLTNEGDLLIPHSDKCKRNACKCFVF